MPMNVKEKVQQHAALRNDYIEMLVDFALRKALEKLAEKGVISKAVWPERHKEFKAVDASDVFDHYFRIKFIKTAHEVEFWGQTTCYKGNELGVAEANKTYEIRETLIEALTLRRHLLASKKEFRILHFTFGPSEYTYSWFEAAKTASFDWSMYSADIVDKYDIFSNLFTLLAGTGSELDVQKRLQIAFSSPSGLRDFLVGFVVKIEEWLGSLPEKNALADKQAKILNTEYSSAESKLASIIKSSKVGGENIKGRVIQAITAGKSSDPHIIATLKRVYDGNGFISTALKALNDWSAWGNQISRKVTNELDLRAAIDLLWNISDDFCITRRLLVRLFSSQSVHYPADLNIRTVTEHTLYTVMYTPEINDQVIDYFLAKYHAAGIRDAKTLKGLLTSSRAKQIVVDALQHDTSNGTTLKPSFYYVEEALKDKFPLVSFEAAGLPLPVGYHSKFSSIATVQSYGNLKVVLGRHGRPIAVIKAKYFRKPEFPRRAKEEAYVGLTAKYDLKGSKFTSRYNLPFIMFVDMDVTLTPPEFALVRLVAAGWLPVFKISDLRDYLQTL